MVVHALPSGQKPAQGEESIRKAFVPSAGAPLKLRPIANGASGELACVIGGWGGASDIQSACFLAGS